MVDFSGSCNMRIRKARPLLILIAVSAATLFFCEFLIYYVTMISCRWPKLNNAESSASQEKVWAMILSDTHMLGPIRGHWFDKLKREWQMHRAFQTALTIFKPEVVFMLGDIFDEGDFVTKEQYKEYVLRFHKVFHMPKETRLIALVGNHDVGFHYRMNPYFMERFENEFSNTGAELHTIKNVHFITINSMAMEDDGCDFCDRVQKEITKISKNLKCSKDPVTTSCKNYNDDIVYSKPIILQHFPTYRVSDAVCKQHDAPNLEIYRENWEVLSKKSTDFLSKMLEPRLVFSGHSHHFCKLRNRMGIEEYTLASFNWRNKNNPSFVLAEFTPDNYAVSVCYMPQESTVMTIYVLVVLGLLVTAIHKMVQQILFRLNLRKKLRKKEYDAMKINLIKTY